jgi:hypothetical protein
MAFPIKLVLDIDEVRTLTTVLGHLPHSQVEVLIGKIRSQSNAQIDAEKQRRLRAAPAAEPPDGNAAG